MKKPRIILSAIYLCTLLALVSCDDSLDITPKGKTTLESVTDLEMLLNQEWALPSSPFSDLTMICNESLGMCESVSSMLSQTNTLSYAYISYDESVDRETLTQTDSRYNQLYQYINYMNVLIEKLPDSDGTDTQIEQLTAEARVIRAYMHWILVNIHAKQYDEDTASKLGGIPYVDETDVSVQKTKLTLQQTYDRILEDCSDELIALLPSSSDVLRADKAFGNAVRAKVLMQMKRYSEALVYADAALTLNGRIEDRSEIMSTETWDLPYDIENNYFYMRGSTRGAPFMEVLSLETLDLFEDGDYVMDYDHNMGWSALYGLMFSDILGSKTYFGFSASVNEYGINSDRMYYTAAECYIRTGEIRKGLKLVDNVRSYRVEDYESFASLYDTQALSEQEAMALLQKAKWVECIGTYENFFDCKRWNSEDDYKRTITRDLGDYGTYTLSPESDLWVFPFPNDAVMYNSSLTQNY